MVELLRAGRLIVVDRAPATRERVKSAARDASHGDESFPCQSSEGLDIAVGVAVGASVYEENAPKLLFRFGVDPPAGDRNDPNVVFTSIYSGKSLAEVMDGPVRSRVQALVCHEISSRTLADDNALAAKIMNDIKKQMTDYMANVGISLDFIGWADTFEFSQDVQAAVNRRFVAAQDIELAKALEPYTTILQALAAAESTRPLPTNGTALCPPASPPWWLPSGIGDWLSKAARRVRAGHTDDGLFRYRPGREPGQPGLVGAIGWGNPSIAGASATLRPATAGPASHPRSERSRSISPDPRRENLP